MRRKLMWLVALGTAVLGAAVYVENIQATPASPGFSASTISVGRLPEFEVTHHLVSEKPEDGSPRSVWLSLQKTKGLSDLYVQSNVWQPGAITGWHTHPGHSLVTVTAGTVTNYDGDDPNCTPKVYTVGMTFVDHGGDHSHLIRNEGFVEARTVAVQLIPAGATRRIDAQGNPACPF